MGNAVKIEGQKLLELFKEIVEKKVIVSMVVVGADVELLTCVTELSESPAGNHLFVDPPRDFKEITATKKVTGLRFSFNGPDQVEYIFSVHDCELKNQYLKVPFPEYAERMQRRRNFRVDTLTDSEMHFRMKKIEGIIHMINVSEGGAYGVLVKHNFKFMRGSVLKLDQEVSDIKMVFPVDGDTPGDTILVKCARILRVEHDKERGLYRYAFKFKEIEKEEHDRLIQVIYALQRKYLQRRK